MTDDTLEQLLRESGGQQPRPQTTEAVFNAARESAARPPSPVAETAAACIAPQKKAGGPNLVVYGVRPRARWPWVLGAAAALVMLAAAGMAAWLMQPAPLMHAGKIAAGPLLVERRGQRLTLQAGEELYIGDALHAAAMVRIELKDGSRLKADTDTRMVLAQPKPGERVRITLHNGRTFVRAAKAPDAFIIDAGATVRVVGTAFGVAAHPEGAEINVLEGAVAVENAGAVLHVTRGESAVAANGVPPQMAKSDANLALLWAREYTTFDQRPLREVLHWIEANSSYRIDLPASVQERSVSISIAAEPPRQMIETVLISCGLSNYRISGFDVIVREP